jgi:hypothetical protein
MSERISTTDLEGAWLPTDSDRQGIVRAVVEAGDDGLSIRVTGAEGTHPVEWGTARVESIYAASPDARTGVAFTAMYELPSMNVNLHVNLSKGLLIIASMTRFIDGRRGVFSREFFRKSMTHATPL